ncbi:MAG: hypothetical protein ACPG7E_01440 [Marinirhabdus sp.]
MKFLIITFVFLRAAQLSAQLESNTGSVRFDPVETEDNYKAPEGLPLPAAKLPSLTNKKNTPPPNSQLGIEDTGFNMSHDEGFLSTKTDTAPKAFTKDKEVEKTYGSDQFLGEVKTKGNTVTVMYRDHQYVDGDRIRIFVNRDVMRGNQYLSGSFNGFTATLEVGQNTIDFQALNQGSSGPNTAQLQVFDEDGLLIAAKQWNLLTGYKATVTVFKEE